MKIKKVLPLMLLFGLGLFVGILGLILAWQAVMPAFWPEVKGIVRDSGITEIEQADDGGNYIIYCPHIRYSYTVDGHGYENDVYLSLKVVSADDKSACETDIEQAMSMAAEFESGGTAVVHFSPADPSISYLKYSAWNCISAGMMIFAGVLLVVISVVIALRE